jgi:DNA-binding beta-propeller fold protein YncE
VHRITFVVGLFVVAGGLVTAADQQRVSVPGPAIWVAGGESDNIVQFDLDTGAATVVAKLPNGSQPRALAVDASGRVFVGLRGRKKNVVKLVRSRPSLPETPLVPVDLTPTIGRFGPGLMAFDHNGLLNIAGDTERLIQRYNVETGEAIEPINPGRNANLVGLTAHGGVVYVAEYFQKSVLRIDATATPVKAVPLLHGGGLLDRPHGMAIGHNGNLFVSNLRDDRVLELDPQSGKVVQVFLDVKTIGARRVNELRFSRRLDHYFISSGDTVYEVASDGTLVARFSSPTISGVQSILVFPADEPVPVQRDASAVEAAR